MSLVVGDVVINPRGGYWKIIEERGILNRPGESMFILQMIVDNYGKFPKQIKKEEVHKKYAWNYKKLDSNLINKMRSRDSQKWDFLEKIIDPANHLELMAALNKEELEPVILRNIEPPSSLKEMK